MDPRLLEFIASIFPWFASAIWGPAAGGMATGIGDALNRESIRDASERDRADMLAAIGDEGLTGAQERVTLEQILGGTGFDRPVSLGGTTFGGLPPILGPADQQILNKDTFGKPGTPYVPGTGIHPGGPFVTGTGGSRPLAAFNIDEQFTSAQTFQDALPARVFDPISFDPLNREDFRYDPTDLQALGSRLGADLRGGAVDFETLLRQSNVEGLTDRAAERYPDFNAFLGSQLSGISEAARGIENLARQETAGQFGSLEEGQTELARRSFANQLSAGQASSGVAAQVEALKAEMAKTLSGLESEEVSTRRGISQDVTADALTRALGATEVEGEMFGLGEQLEAQNLGLLAEVGQFNRGMQADIDRFNRTFPVDLASRGAQFQNVDETGRMDALMGFILPQLQASLAAAGYDVDLEKLKALVRTSFTEALPLLSQDSFWNWQQGELAKDAARGGGRGGVFGLNIDPLALFGGGG